MAQIEVTVSLADDHLKKLDDVLARLRKAGLKGAQALREIGIVTGRVEESSMAKLSDVKGVSGVEAAQGYQLPPPDADVQ